ncbi:autophagy-related protein 18a-like [Phragmites australis]|uniref:autophagy-related protein 18a-like n=1 Tax=Phragmites australis TaxID=29695 RepID=UPI002D77FFE2|nr:autophagy-related protein 18a-like [Phragmites australis]
MEDSNTSTQPHAYGGRRPFWNETLAPVQCSSHRTKRALDDRDVGEVPIVPLADVPTGSAACDPGGPGPYPPQLASARNAQRVVRTAWTTSSRYKSPRPDPMSPSSPLPFSTRSMTMASPSAAADSLVHVAFNSKATHFVAATATGIRVFSCSPLEHVFSKSSFASPDSSGSAGEVTSADVILSGHLVAVVFRESADAADSSGRSDKIRYWSELYRQMMSEDMGPSCRGVVRAVRHVGSHVLVAGEDKVTVHEMSRCGVKRTNGFDTGPNPLGLCALAQVDRGAQAFVLACPLPAKGEVQVRRPRGCRVDVPAHNSSIACVALSRDGRLLATAGSKGTLLRIFSTTDGKKLQELRRGADRADIHCMAFSPDSKWLAASSDKGTIHVFSVKVDLTSWTPEDGDNPDGPNTASAANSNQGWSRSFLSGFVQVPRYFKQDCSLAKFRLREGVKYLVAFSHEPHTVLIIGMDGSFYRCKFDPVKAGDMKQLEYRNFMKMK